MRKSDDSIKQIVTASIKRHSIDIENWALTKLWDDVPEPIQLSLAKKVELSQTELGIIGYLESDDYGYLITTQRIIIYENGELRSIKISDISNYEIGMYFTGFMGHRTETITLHCKDGQNDEFRFETGNPSMGAIYGLMTVLSVGKT